MRLPTLFVSHGSPSMLLEPGPACRFLSGLGSTLPRPRALLVASPHWATRRPAVGASAAPPCLHDFHGFPAPLYRVSYQPPGAPALAERVVELLTEAGIGAAADPRRGLDHGVWQPLLLAWPDADVPVLPLSVQPQAGPAHHLRLGEALAPLSEEGVLVVGSGSLTHNLAEWGHRPLEAEEPPWVSEFAEWAGKRLAAGDREALIEYRRRAPHAARNHPTEEHFLPLLVALGAAGRGARARRLHASVTYGVLRMDAYRFDSAPA